GDQRFGGGAQHRERAIAGLAEFGIGIERHAGLEHGGIIRRLSAGERQVRSPQTLESREWIRTPVIPGLGERRSELREAAQRYVRQKLVAIAKMPVRSRGTDASGTRRFSKCEPGGALLGDQVERRLHQGFLEVAVVIAARSRFPAHVNSFYM